MGRLAKCKKCGIDLQPNERFVKSSKTYCHSCYETLNQDAEDYKQLIATICEYFSIDAPTGLILKQIKEYKDNLKYPHSAMTYTLWYCKEILEKQFEVKYGVAVIKYQFEDAKNYYIQQQNIAKKVEELKDVKIKKKIVNRSERGRKGSSNLIDLNDLLKG